MFSLHLHSTSQHLKAKLLQEEEEPRLYQSARTKASGTCVGKNLPTRHDVLASSTYLISSERKNNETTWEQKTPQAQPWYRPKEETEIAAKNPPRA